MIIEPYKFHIKTAIFILVWMVVQSWSWERVSSNCRRQKVSASRNLSTRSYRLPICRSEWDWQKCFNGHLFLAFDRVPSLSDTIWRSAAERGFSRLRLARWNYSVLSLFVCSKCSASALSLWYKCTGPHTLRRSLGTTSSLRTTRMRTSVTTARANEAPYARRPVAAKSRFAECASAATHVPDCHIARR